MPESDTISWSKNSLLHWSDFKADANPAFYEDSHSTIHYRYIWTLNSEKINGQIQFNIENIDLFTEFHSQLSWVRPEYSDNNLLKHEQGHFDLSELIKNEHISSLQGIFYDKYFPTRGNNEEQRKQFAKEDSGKMISIEVEKLEHMLEKKRNEYDQKTDFGKNLTSQSEYDTMFESLRS